MLLMSKPNSGLASRAQLLRVCDRIQDPKASAFGGGMPKHAPCSPPAGRLGQPRALVQRCTGRRVPAVCGLPRGRGGLDRFAH